MEQETNSINEQSFQHFQSTKKVCSVKDALDISDEDLELFKEVEKAFVYDGRIVIFEIKEGCFWEYNSFETTSCKYAAEFDAELVESNELETLERQLFKMLTAS